MHPEVQDFRYHDPRRLPGDPFQVAEATFKQALAVGELYKRALHDAFIFARNAEMERQLLAGDDPDGAGFSRTSLGNQIGCTRIELTRLQSKVRFAAKAAAYDPTALVEELV